MQQRALGKTGLRVSVLGFGASPLGGVFEAIDEAEGIRAVHAALDAGINLIDVAPYYGLTKAETVLGKALVSVPRDRYLLATKVGRYGHAPSDFDFSAKRVVASVDESLRRLGVAYVDLIQCHDIEFGTLDQIAEETLPALRRVQEQGKARFVGITGLPLKALGAVAERTDVDTILSYCHYTLHDNTLADLLPFMGAKQVGVISASPLAMGLLTQQGPPSWHPAPPEVKAACERARAFCQTRNADLAQLALQWALANPHVATTLVGMASAENVRKNVAWAQSCVDEALLADVQAILAPIHNVTWASGRPENN